MKLSGSVLCTHLPGVVAHWLPQETVEGLTLARPLLWEDWCAVEPDSTYIIYDWEWEGCTDVPPGCTFLCIGKTPESRIGSCEIIEFSDDASPRALHNAVQQLFDRFDAWDDALQRSLNASAGLKSILEHSIDLFGDHLLVSDPNYYAVAYACETEEETQRFLSLLKDGMLSAEIVNGFKLDPAYHRIHERRHPFVYTHDLILGASLCFNLYNGEHYIGRLTSGYVRQPIRPGDDLLFAHLGHRVETAMQWQIAMAQSRGDSLEAAVYNLLEDGYIERHVLLLRLESAQCRLHDEYVAVSIQQNQVEIENFLSSYIASQLRDQYGSVCAFAYTDVIVAYFNLRTLGYAIDDLLVRISVFLREWDLRAGSSNPFSDFSLAREHFIQSRAALEFGISNDKTIWHYRFSDIALAYLLKKGTSELPPELVSPPGLLRLRAADGVREGSLYTTLRSFLQEERHVVRCAKALFIHRSTLLYRLDRIGEITGFNLDKADLRLYLTMSFALLDHAK